MIGQQIQTSLSLAKIPSNQINFENLKRGCQDDVLNQPQGKYDCTEIGDAYSINHAKGTEY